MVIYKNPVTNTLIIINTYNKRQLITRLCTNQGWKGFGVLSAPGETWDDHVKYVKDDKIAPWNNSILTRYLQKHDIYCAASTSIFKTVDYFLPATYIIKKE